MSLPIKFCGLTRLADVQQALALDVHAIGLIFAPRSKRRLDLREAARLSDAARGGTCIVALVQDQDAEEVAQIVRTVRPQVLQFHGNESADFCDQFGLPWWKAIGIEAQTTRSDIAACCASFAKAHAMVLDAKQGGAFGGSGARFDWHKIPAGAHARFVLAGGLDAHNVAEAWRVARPWLVDVSSGIESSPGIKDHDKMRAFAREVARALETGN
jgi:phosphoribosylanthranilate isomerase